MKISVIICTYNREPYIYKALQSIARNVFPHANYELLVIDNNSRDHTAQECARFHADFPEVAYRYCHEPQQGLSQARNRGIAEAAGDILLYVDDDATVNPGFLHAYYDFFAQYPAAMAAGGPVVPVFETEQPDWLPHLALPLITGYFRRGARIAAFGKRGFPRGGNAAFRKTVFEKTGGFNTALGRKGDTLTGAEEKDIFDKMRTHRLPFYYVPDAVLYHLVPAAKLTDAYFTTLTRATGRSERLRTRAISKRKYAKRLLLEAVKWGAALMLFVGYVLVSAPRKGWTLLRFRWNISAGLLRG